MRRAAQLIAAGLGTRVDRLIEQHESPILKSLERIYFANCGR